MAGYVLFGGAMLLVVLVGVWATAHGRYRREMAQAETAWSDIAGRATPAPAAFSPNMVADLPEVARRYFDHAIASGTPLHTRVELLMSGDFLLGEKGAQQTFAMQARQILAPPHEFVWIAQMSRGLLRISGSDGLHGGHGWTRFWMLGSLPLVQRAATPDIDRAAAARPAMEAIWTPAALLPANGATWVQTGPDTANVTFGTGRDPITITMRIGADGAVKEVFTNRWSDVNPDKTFRLQPFGAMIEGEVASGGFTVPGRVTVGNHFGTPDFLPFFRADIARLRYF